MTLPTKLEDITPQMLQALVDDGVREKKTIEYKRDLWNLKTDSGKKELLADVVSFANASGGDILVGVEEEKDLPKAIVGIEVPDHGELTLRINQVIRSGLDPRLPQCEPHLVSLGGQRCVLVIRIGRSWCGPHMVKESGRFHSRSSNGKTELDVRQIRDAMLATEEIGKRMAVFRAERTAKIMANEAAQDVGNGAKVIAHLLPEESFRPGSSVDLSRVGHVPMINGHSWPTTHNFDGVATAQKKHDGSPFGYTQVFRNGVVEAVECTWLERSPNFPEYIEGFLLQFTEKSLATIEQLGLGMPIYAAFTFVGVRGFNLHVGENIRLNVRRSVPLRMDVLLLPEQRFESRDVSAATILRPAFNVLGNAFGLPGSPHYDADGERIER